MNKALRIVWNKTRGMYVVASEVSSSAQGHAKAAVAAAVIGLTLGGGVAQALV